MSPHPPNKINFVTTQSCLADLKIYLPSALRPCQNQPMKRNPRDDNDHRFSGWSQAVELYPAVVPRFRWTSRPHPSHGALVWLLLLLLLLASCAGIDDHPPGTAPARNASPSSTAPTPATSTPANASTEKLLVIMEENRSVADVSTNMPYLSTTAERFGRTTQYYALAHPSLPNYLVIAGGSQFGVTDDDGPASHPLTGPSVFGQLFAAGLTTKTYAEAMHGTCAQRNQGRYAVRHNPWTYFTDPTEKAACHRFDVPAGTTTAGPLTRDIVAGALPTFGLVIPDICNDGHDCSAATADRWLQRWLPIIESGSDFTTGRLTIIVTWDEDDGSHNNRITCVVIHPSLAGRTVDTHLTHYALSAAISGLANEHPLRDAGDAPDLLHAFGLA